MAGGGKCEEKMRQGKGDKECRGQGFGEAGFYKGWSEKNSDKLTFEQRPKEGERELQGIWEEEHSRWMESGGVLVCSGPSKEARVARRLEQGEGPKEAIRSPASSPEPTGHGEDWMKLQEDTEQRSDII